MEEAMQPPIRVAILEDHQSIIDGYIYRLKETPEIEISGTALRGDELEPVLNSQTPDVLLLDIYVPTGLHNPNPFPVLHVIPRLLQKYPDMSIVVISMLTHDTLIEALVEAGISGYIFKDDRKSIQQLAKIVIMIANGGIYFSHEAHQRLRAARTRSTGPILTARQLEALSLCAAYPDSSSFDLAKRLGVANSTLRNLLSSAYLRLDVRTRAAAIARAQQLGLLISPTWPDPGVGFVPPE
jgi:DNA-binding NarL/FixJ family response regulator